MSTSIASGTFPQLFRRSAFVQHDRNIVRIHTTTPSSAQHTRDWGHKYPIHKQSKPPKYVRVTQMDLGRHVTSDWGKAESEARLMRMWGSGKVRWMEPDATGTSDSPLPIPPRRTMLGDQEEKQAERYIEDVDAMWPSEFKKYMGRIQDSREQFLKNKLERLNPVVQQRLTLAEDNTLVSLGARRFATSEDVNRAHNQLAQEDLSDPNRAEMQSQRHPIGGLAYSEPAPNAGRYNPYLQIPGRALERSHNYHGIYVHNRAVLSEHNRPFVVSVGGLTGRAAQTLRRVDDDIRHVNDTIDWSRADQKRGEAKWRVTDAQLKGIPRVMRDIRKDISYHGVGQRPLLREFKFDLNLEYGSPTDTQARSPEFQESPAAPVPGTREWVASEPVAAASIPSIFNESNSLGLGLAGRRKEPTNRGSSALRRLAASEARGQQERKAKDMKMVSDILRSMQTRKPEEGDQK